MADTTQRPSTVQRMLLQMHPGKTLREIVVDAYEKGGTLVAAAELLGISDLTLRHWLKDLGLGIEVEVRVERRGRLVPLQEKHDATLAAA